MQLTNRSLWYILAAMCGALAATTYLYIDLRLSTPHQPQSYAAALEQTLPAVVSIYSRRNHTEAPAIWENPIFSGYESRLRKSETGTPRLGAGVVIDAEGHILTNYHVVAMTDDIEVSMADGSMSPAHLIGKDPAADIAVLKLGKPPLGYIEQLNTRPMLGDIVLAIGNPFGVGQAVTQGIISGLDRNNLGLAEVENYIQTDVAINPGNSGGALIDTQGRLVGIVTAIYSSSGSYQGISFAIPAPRALSAASILIHRYHESDKSAGPARLGYLGVEMHKLSSIEAKFFGLESTNGLLINRIHPDSPAEEVGLKAGDVLLAIDGRALTTPEEARELVRQASPATALSLTVFSRGATRGIQVNVQTESDQ